MQQQPVWALSLPAIVLLGIVVLIAWQAINHRKGLPLVLVSCALVLAGGVMFYWLHYQDTLAYVASPIAPPTEASTLPGDGTVESALPAWVNQPPRKVDGDFVFTVSAGPYATEQECQRQLTAELRKSIDAFVDNFLDVPGAGRRVDLEMTVIHNRLVQETVFRTSQHSFGQMQNLHALVRIDRAMQDLIRQRHQVALRQARLGYAGGAFGLLLVLLATAFGYLKLDTLTKGYYSGRLKLAATAVILTAAAATALVVRQVDPAANWPLKLPFTQSPQLVQSPI